MFILWPGYQLSSESHLLYMYNKPNLFAIILHSFLHTNVVETDALSNHVQGTIVDSDRNQGVVHISIPRLTAVWRESLDRKWRPRSLFWEEKVVARSRAWWVGRVRQNFKTLGFTASTSSRHQGTLALPCRSMWLLWLFCAFQQWQQPVNGQRHRSSAFKTP